MDRHFLDHSTKLSSSKLVRTGCTSEVHSGLTDVYRLGLVPMRHRARPSASSVLLSKDPKAVVIASGDVQLNMMAANGAPRRSHAAKTNRAASPAAFPSYNLPSGRNVKLAMKGALLSGPPACAGAPHGTPDQASKASSASLHPFSVSASTASTPPALAIPRSMDAYCLTASPLRPRTWDAGPGAL